MGYKVGSIQSTIDDQRQFAGPGFNVTDMNGRPLVTFGFPDRRVAAEAYEAFKRFVEIAVLIKPHPG